MAKTMFHGSDIDTLLHLLMENMQDYAVVITDPQGTVLEWQGGAEDITGYTAAEAIGQKIHLLFTTDDIANEKPEQEMIDAKHWGRSKDKRWHVRKDGALFFADGVVAPLSDAHGNLRGFGKIFRDATEERYTIEALARVTMESERRKRLYETILSNTPDLAYVFDLDHRFTYANEILLQMWGKTWDEAIGKTCLELGYEPWHAEMHDREIEQVKATKKPIRGEVPFHGTFGRRIYEYIFVPVLGPDGEVEAIAGTTRDVTERKQAEEEMAKLLEAEKRRNTQLAQVGQASKTMNTVLSVHSISRIFTEEVRAIIGAHGAITSLTAEANGTQAIETKSLSVQYKDNSLDDMGAMGETFAIETCRLNKPIRLTRDEFKDRFAQQANNLKSPDIHIVHNFLAVPLMGHGGKNLGLLQLIDKYEGDFTEEDEAIVVQLAAIAAIGIENARLYDSLREQDRRKDEFLATLAHELRNPLAPMRSGLEILRATGELKGSANKIRDIMERQLTLMVRLIDDLMDVSRLSQGKMTLNRERISLQTVFDTALETSLPLIEASHHTVEIAMPQTPLYIRGDVTRLAQVLSNLINNAVKYTAEGGHIKLSAERQRQEVMISVQDNGVGIPSEMLHKVFDLFTQVGRTMDRAQGGLGIGLSLAKKLVEMHGGTLTAHSDGPGRGSTFTVRLSLDDLTTVDEDTTQQLNGGSLNGLSSLRILVVDDNVDVAESFATLLELSGHKTCVAHSGPDGIAAAGHYRPDVVFLDIGLPGMNGYEVVNKLKENPILNDTLMVAVTGWGSEEDRKRSRQAGFDLHLAKPVDATALANVLSQRSLKKKTPDQSRRNM